jgi:3-oxoadipate enol-lactonase
MPLRKLDTATELVHQTGGDPSSPAILFLPGVHGDWTPQTRARSELIQDFHLVETAYPRVKHWAIADFARSLNALLDHLGIESAHIVGESFGSLVGWQFGVEYPDRVKSFTLLGGFSRPPRFRVAAAAATALKRLPTGVLESGIDLYVAGKSVIGEHREKFDTGAYPATRTPSGRLATANRMSIIQATDFREHLAKIDFPVRYLGGANDIVVPVRREISTLMEHLPPECEFQGELIKGAPHPIIASHPEQTAQQLSHWVHEIEANIGKPAKSAESTPIVPRRSGDSS